ncbi:MAG: hypothetical protein AAF790_04485 [Planctomycetota bacterium]
MSERERWIVYPLLFLALGAALRDKLMQQTRADQLVCNRLIVVDDAGKVVTKLEGGAMRLGVIDADSYRRNGQPLVAKRPSAPGMWEMLQRLQRSGALKVTPRVAEPINPSGAAGRAGGAAGAATLPPAVQEPPRGDPAAGTPAGQ